MSQQPPYSPKPHDGFAQPGQSPQQGQQPAAGMPYGAPGPGPYGAQPHGMAPGHVPMQPMAGPMGVIDFTMQGSVMTGNMLVPTVIVNGNPVRSAYGHQAIAVPAGPVRVEVYAQWMRRYGQATLDFHIQPGQHVPVFYAQPYHQFTTGSIGHQEQKRKGLGALIAIIGGVTAFILLMILFAALAV